MAGTSIKHLKYFFISLVIASALSGCGKKKPEGKPVYLKEAGYILEINDTTLLSQPDVLTVKLLPGQLLKKLKSGHNDHYYIHWIYTGKTKAYVLAFTAPTDSLPRPGERTASYGGKKYFVSTKDSVESFRYVTDTTTVFTLSLYALKKYINNGYVTMPSGTVKIIAKGRNSEAFGNWYIQPEKILHKQDLPIQSLMIRRFNGNIWIWDIEAPGLQKYEGAGYETLPVADLRDAFSATEPSTNQLTDILKDENQFTLLSFESFPIWAKHWADFLASKGYTRPTLPSKKYKPVKAIAYVPGNAPALLIQSTRPEEIFEKLEPFASIGDVDFFKNPDSTVISSFLYPLTPHKAFPWMAYKNRLVVMSADRQTLLDYLINDNFGNTDKNIEDFLAAGFHLLKREGNRWFGIRYDNQLIFQNYADFSFIDSPKKISGGNKYLKREYVLAWPDELHYGPAWIYNHRSRQYELIFQDKNNRLVLLDGQGKPRWKKNIDEPVMGKIHQLDMFRNGKRQFLFTTHSGIYIMDIRGTYVKPFPIHTRVSGPAGLFDYDRNRHYRIAVPADNKLMLYDVNGKMVKGFAFDKLNAPLQSAPQHLRIAGKDYIFLQQTDGKLWILNRRGEERIKVSDSINSKDGIWKTYQGGFITVDNNNRIQKLNISGKMQTLTGTQKFKYVIIANEHFAATGNDDTIYIDGKPSKEIPSGAKPLKIFRSGRYVYFCFTKDGQGYIFRKGNTRTLPVAPADCSADLKHILVKKSKLWTIYRLQ